MEILGVLREPEISLVMEFVHHGSLQSYLKIYKESLAESQLLKYALDIAKVNLLLSAYTYVKINGKLLYIFREWTI